MRLTIKQAKKLWRKKRSRGTSGCFGTYYRLNKSVGAKEITHIQKKRSSKIEYNNLKEARRRCRLVPKPYLLLQIGKNYIIFMEHIEGKKAYNLEAIEILKKHLRAKGIFHRDLHQQNVINSDGTYRPIDFGGNYIRFKKREK
jgi:tRNA A-37 threonylcarbamoyl transferase component Bud32